MVFRLTTKFTKQKNNLNSDKYQIQVTPKIYHKKPSHQQSSALLQIHAWKSLKMWESEGQLLNFVGEATEGPLEKEKERVRLQGVGQQDKQELDEY